MNFFNYFIEISEEEESFEQAKILKDYIDSCLKTLPKNFKEIVEFSHSLVDLDDSILKIFSSTTPQVICAYLHTSFSPLIFDEFYFFYEKCPLLATIKKEKQNLDVAEIIYEIVLAVSYLIKKKIPESSYEFEEIVLSTQDKKNLKSCPKNLTEAIDQLMVTLENKQFLFESIESVDVFTCYLFADVNFFLFYKWCLHLKESPLRKWFETERAIYDPYYMVYYIIRNLVHFLKLKHS